MTDRIAADMGMESACEVVVWIHGGAISPGGGCPGNSLTTASLGSAWRLGRISRVTVYTATTISEEYD